MSQRFDPDHALGGGIFGLPYTAEESGVILIPMPWETTVSWGAGTAKGPEAMLAISPQIDLLDREVGTPYEEGIHMLPVDEDVRSLGERARARAEPVVRAGGAGNDPDLIRATGEVNILSEEFNARVYDIAKTWLAKGRLVGGVGGDHSSPFGLMRAVSERHPDMGILHIDAHADLREAFEGFTWSHASIMFNVYRKLAGVSRIVQVGIRDYAPTEMELIEASGMRFTTFFDADVQNRLLDGEPWSKQIKAMVNALPKEVFVSFDIDGLDPSLCPNTGTPVPGGLSFQQAVRLLSEVVRSGRKIVGFDLNEVAPHPDGVTTWNENVGMRLLYKLIGFAVKSRSKTR